MDRPRGGAAVGGKRRACDGRLRLRADGPDHDTITRRVAGRARLDRHGPGQGDCRPPGTTRSQLKSNNSNRLNQLTVSARLRRMDDWVATSFDGGCWTKDALPSSTDS